MILHWNNIPVPYTAAWSGEEEFYLAECCHVHQRAVCQKEAQGEGRPLFGKPHMNRQREVIANDLCDLCRKPLTNRTKVSLSHAQSRLNAAPGGTGVLQVEPLLHKECAIESIKHCPSLQRDIRGGTIRIRQVLQHRHQVALIDGEETARFTGISEPSCGHAKVELMAWKNRDLAWLGLTAISLKDPRS